MIKKDSKKAANFKAFLLGKYLLKHFIYKVNVKKNILNLHLFNS